MKITTNNHFRDLLYWHDLSEKQQEEFDYISEDGREWASFVVYKGWPYHVQDQLRASEINDLNKWDIYQSETMWSGVCFLFDEQNERVKCGSYTSG